MAIQIPWTIEMMGIAVPEAYVRLHRFGRATEPHPDTGALRLGDLRAEFAVYASATARQGRKDAVAYIAVSVPAADVRWGADLAAQAYAGLKALYPDGIDLL